MPVGAIVPRHGRRSIVTFCRNARGKGNMGGRGHDGHDGGWAKSRGCDTFTGGGDMRRICDSQFTFLGILPYYSLTLGVDVWETALEQLF